MISFCSSSAMCEPLKPHSLARMYSLSAPTGLKTQRVRGGVSERRHGSTRVCTSPNDGASIPGAAPPRRAVRVVVSRDEAKPHFLLLRVLRVRVRRLPALYDPVHAEQRFIVPEPL